MTAIIGKYRQRPNQHRVVSKRRRRRCQQSGKHLWVTYVSYVPVRAGPLMSTMCSRCGAWPDYNVTVSVSPAAASFQIPVSWVEIELDGVTQDTSPGVGRLNA